MKLFENGVGRPSNEIKRKRKIFIASAIILCVALVSVFTFTLTKVDTNRLKGYAEADVKADVRVNSAYSTTYLTSTHYLDLDLGLFGAGSVVKEIAYTVCTTYADCNSSDAWKNGKSKEAKVEDGGPDIKNVKTSGAYATVYIRVRTYYGSDPSTWLWNGIYKYSRYDAMRNPDGDKNKEKLELVDEYINSNIVTKTPSQPAAKQNLWIGCQDSATVGNTLACSVKIGNSNGSYVTDATVSAADSSIATIKNNGNGTYNVTFNDKLFEKYDSQKKYGQTLKKYFIKSSLKATHSNYNSATTYVYIYEKPFTLECPDTAKTYEPFKCSTNQSGVKISVLAKNGLADNYSPTFTTGSDKTKDIYFTEDLFIKYSNQIKDKNTDKPYINAAITAEKSGYTKITKYVKVYEGTKPSSSGGSNGGSNVVEETPETEVKEITLTCPSKSEIDKEFKCTTNLEGVKISVGGSKALADGYTSSSSTKSDDLTKKVKYTSDLFNGKVVDKKYIYKDKYKKEYINATITAKKDGYKTVTKKVKIYRKEVSISCPSEWPVNEEFTCTTDLEGVTIRGSYEKELAKGYSLKEKTKAKKFKYTKEGTTVWVEATKDGYNFKQVKVKIVLPRYQVYYSVPKVVKEDDNGTKKISIKPYRLGMDVESYKFAVCKDRDTCFEKNSSEGVVVSAKLTKENLNKSGTLTLATDDKNLLGSTFYIRTMATLKDGSEYWKVHKFYVDLETLKNSEHNKEEDDETKVAIGDSAGASHDFLMSSKNKPSSELKAWDAYYAVTSVMKIDDPLYNRIVNVNLHNVGSKVRYVEFGICESGKDCEQYVEDDENIISSTQKYEAKPGTGIELYATMDGNDLLNEKLYISILTFDENENLLYHKVHKFTTASKTKNGIKKESKTVFGDRAATEMSGVKYKKHFK